MAAALLSTSLLPGGTLALAPSEEDTFIATAGDTIYVRRSATETWVSDSVPDSGTTLWSYLFTASGEWTGAGSRVFFRAVGETGWSLHSKPSNARVEALEIHDGGVFALTDDTLFRLDASTNLWVNLGKPWPGHTARALASYGDVLYIGVGDAVYSWNGTYAFQGSPGPIVYSLSAGATGLLVGTGDGSVQVFDVGTNQFSSLGKPKGSVDVKAILQTADGILAAAGKSIYLQNGAGWGLHSTPASVAVQSLSLVPALQLPPPNRVPVLDPVGDRSGSEGAAISFALSARDPDGDPLTFSATGLPAGAEFEAPTRTFSWTPNFDQAGNHSGATFSVSDGRGGEASESITIQISNVNRAPQIEAPARSSIPEMETLSFGVVASDPDGDQVIVEGVGLPPGATFDGVSRTFSWTPSYDQAGQYSISFSASDGSLSAHATSTVEVVDVNRLPTATFGFGPATPKSFDDVQFTDQSHDPDGPLAAWQYDFGDGGVSSARNASHSYSAPGSYVVTLTVTDGAGAAGMAQEVVSVVNRPPSLAPTTSSNQPEVEEDVVRFQARAADLDGTVTSISWNFGDGSVATGETVDHVFQAPGSHIVRVTATDDAGDASSAEMTIMVREKTVIAGSFIAAVNDAPQAGCISSACPPFSGVNAATYILSRSHDGHAFNFTASSSAPVMEWRICFIDAFGTGLACETADQSVHGLVPAGTKKVRVALRNGALANFTLRI